MGTVFVGGGTQHLRVPLAAAMMTGKHHEFTVPPLGFVGGLVRESPLTWICCCFGDFCLNFCYGKLPFFTTIWGILVFFQAPKKQIKAPPPRKKRGLTAKTVKNAGTGRRSCHFPRFPFLVGSLSFDRPGNCSWSTNPNLWHMIWPKNFKATRLFVEKLKWWNWTNMFFSDRVAQEKPATTTVT